MRKHIGWVVVGLAGLHQAVGLFFYRAALSDIAQAGVFNTVVPPYWDRDAAYWFFFTGFMLLLVGLLTQWMMEQVGTLPRFLGWLLLTYCVVGVLLMPATGLWLVMPAAVVMITIANKSHPQVA